MVHIKFAKYLGIINIVNKILEIKNKFNPLLRTDYRKIVHFKRWIFKINEARNIK